jgi:hypothetical protein
VADLVSLLGFKDFLGVESVGDDDVLDALLDAVEEAFEQEAGRTARPFRAAQTGRAEVRNGTGDDLLYLDYAITTIASIIIGPDPLDPRESLDPDAVDVVAWRAGERWIRRVDCGVWGCRDEPNAVRITYDAAADLPLSPALAIKRVAAAIYRQRGAEDVTSEQTSTFLRSLKFGNASAGDIIWDLALRPYRAELR